MRFFRPVPRVSLAHASDAGELARLLGVEPGDVEAWLSGGFELYRAELDGRLVGCVRCVFPTGACVIDMLTVAEPDRGRGFGQYLAEHAISRARRAGAGRAWTQVRLDAAPALALARKVGFREAARHSVAADPAVVLLELTL